MARLEVISRAKMPKGKWKTPIKKEEGALQKLLSIDRRRMFVVHFFPVRRIKGISCLARNRGPYSKGEKKQYLKSESIHEIRVVGRSFSKSSGSSVEHKDDHR